jgi:hypothetical protein
MSKLQSLRKTIEKDPEKWIKKPTWGTGPHRAMAAWFRAGEWIPQAPGWYFGHSYVAFVRHCLTELGYLPKKAGGRQRRCGTCGRLYVPRVKRR